jgi:protein-disulfide isomerase-like protein with CxxC motif
LQTSILLPLTTGQAITERLAYAFDPLCGWCYGFGPALRATRAALLDTHVERRFGGVVTGGRIDRYFDKRACTEAAQVRLRAVTGLVPGPDFPCTHSARPIDHRKFHHTLRAVTTASP